MKRSLAMMLALVLGLSVTAAAQCPGCSKDGEKGQVTKKEVQDKKDAKKEECGNACESTGSCCQDSAAAKLAALSKAAKKGCETSKATLAKVQKELGTECCDEAATKLATLEKNAAGGCKESAAKLATIKHVMAGDQDKNAKKEEKKDAKKEECAKECESTGGQCCQDSASTKLAALSKAAKNGCETSKATLAKVQKELGTECCDEAATKLATLEKNAAGGCKESAAKLATVKKLMTPATEEKKDAKKEEPKAETMSGKLTALSQAADKGCETSKAKLTAIKKELGTECCTEAGTKLATLEKNAANGCKESAAKLATIKKMMDGEAKKECEGCPGEKKECPAEGEKKPNS